MLHFADIYFEMSDFTAELKAIMTKCHSFDEMQAYLKSLEFFEPLDIKLSAADETAFLELMDGHGVAKADIRQAIGCKKLYVLAARATAAQPGAAPAAQPASEEASLSPEVVETLQKAWVSVHGYNLNGHRLVAEGPVNKIWRGLNAKSPKELVVVNLEKIKLVSNLLESLVTGTLLTDDGRIQHRRDNLELMTNVHQFNWKFRGLMTTYAYCSKSIGGDFFSFER